jgi:hypothetical protein
LPQVGATSTYLHTIRITNTSARAMDLSIASAPGAGLLWAFSQGQSIVISFDTEYSPDSRIVSTSANVGTASVRGQSVVWDGTLGAGQSVEIRTTLDHTPQTALVLNQPIRGQSLLVRDDRGLTLAVAPAAQPRLPQLPPAQRIVQPPPPPVDPITGSRFFEATSFAISDDNLWNYFVRRGGERTFGAPISRQFVLMGRQVQLFEKAMLTVDEAGTVASVNLLEPPFLPYDWFGDLRLPPVDEELLAAGPDPAAPDFADLEQEFVRAAAAETWEEKPTRFYSTFLATVLYSDAFFLGPGDPGLLPGFDLEIWGRPQSQPSYNVIGYELIPDAGPDGDDLLEPVLEETVVLLRFQRGVMRYDHATGATSGIPLGHYLRAILTGAVSEPEFAELASWSPLWEQYNTDGDPATWLSRPEELPDTNLQFAFEPLESAGGGL